MGFSLETNMRENSNSYHAKMEAALRIFRKAKAVAKREQKKLQMAVVEDLVTLRYDYDHLGYGGKMEQSKEIEISTLTKAARNLAYDALFNLFTYDSRYIALSKPIYEHGHHAIIKMRNGNVGEYEIFDIDPTEFSIHIDISGNYYIKRRSDGKEADQVDYSLHTLKGKPFEDIYAIYKALKRDKHATRGKTTIDDV